MSVQDGPERGGESLSDSLQVLSLLPNTEHDADGNHSCEVSNAKFEEIKWLVIGGALADLLPEPGAVLCEVFVNAEQPRIGRIRFSANPNYIALRYSDDELEPWIYITLGFIDELGLIDASEEENYQVACVAVGVGLGAGGTLVTGRQSSISSTSEWIMPLVPDEERLGTFEDVRCLRRIVDVLARPDSPS